MEARQDQRPEGWLRGGRGSHAWRGLLGLRSGGAGPAFPLPSRLGKSAWLWDRVLCPQRSPPDPVGPRDVGGRPGENRRSRQQGPSRTRGAGKEWRVFALPTRARGAC